MTRARNSANLASHGNLFVDIANDRTGIGSVVPAQNLHVAGTTGFHADVTFTGDLYNTTWDRSDNSLKFVDNAKIKVGTSENLQIYYDGSSYITNSTAGHLFIKTLNGGSDIHLRSADDFFVATGGDNNWSIIARDHAAVELYHNVSKKFETTAYGTNTTGTAVNDGLVVAGVATVTTMNVTGVLTYDDVTSVDSVGIVTARQGVHIDDSIVHIGDTNTKIRFPSNDQISFETGGSEQMKVAGTNITLGTNATTGHVLQIKNRGNDCNSAGALGLDIQAAWMRIGDALSGGQTYGNGLGIKFHDSGVIHWSVGTRSSSFHISNTSNSGTQLFPSSRVDALVLTNTGNATFSNNVTVSGNLGVTGTTSLSSTVTIPDSIVHDGDTDTKIRFPAADQISFETAGNTRVGITTRVAISNHNGNALTFGQLSVRTNTGGDPVCLYLGAFANHPSATGLSTAIMIDNQNAQRSEIRFNNNHNGNWHESAGNTQHLRLIWTAPNENSTTPEVCEIKPTVAHIGATGAFSSLRFRVTDNTNGLVSALTLSSGSQHFYVDGSSHFYVNSDGIAMRDKLIHINDTDTCVRFPANDTITFETAGSTRFGLSSSGNIELHGTQTGNNVATIFNGSGFLGFYASSNSGVNRDFRFFSSNSNSNESLRIASNGNVNVYKDLDVDGHTELDNVRIVGIVTASNVTVSGNQILGHGNSTGNQIKFTRSGLGDELVIGTDGYGNSTQYEATIQSSIVTARPLVFATNNTERFRITGDGVIGINDNNPGSGKKVKVTVANNSSYQMAVNLTNNINADINFYIKTNESLIAPSTNTPLCLGTGGAEKLRITSAGNIEIQGTRAGALQANDDDALKLFTKSATGDINRGVGITFYTHDGGGYEMGGTIQVAKENGTTNNAASYMRFSTQSGSTTTERLRITSGGQVNIGGNYTQTSKTLYVDGAIETTNNITCMNQVYINGTAPQVVFTDTNQDSDYTIKNDGGQLVFIDRTNSNATRLFVNTGGFGGDRLYIANDIVHTGDTDTKIEFGTDIINFDTGGGERLRIDNDLVNIKGGNLHVGTDGATANFTDSNGGNTKHIEIGATGGGDALLTTHASGYGIGYFGYHTGMDRLVVACDQGGGNNSIDFVTTAGTSTGGGTDNLHNKNPRFRIQGNGGFRAEFTDSNEVHAITNYDHGNNAYIHRGGRTLHSNGTGWDGNESSDGSDPILVLSVSNRAGNSDIGDAYGLQLHSESQDDNDYAPMIGWTCRSNSGNYNTTIAAIVAQKTGQAADHNWSSGALHFFTNKPGAYMDNVADMSINHSGHVSTPRNPSFLAEHTHASGNHKQKSELINSYIRNFQRVRHNTGNCYNNTTGKFTAPSDGMYLFHIDFSMDGGDGNDDSAGCYFRIENNSTYYNRTHSSVRDFHSVNPRLHTTSTGYEMNASFQTIEQLATGATVGWYFTDWDFTNTRITTCFFSGYKIG